MQVEVRKKAVHIMLGIGFVYLLAYGFVNIWLFVLLVPLFLLAIQMRKHSRHWDAFMSRFDRRDKKGGVGATWFLLGVLLVWLIFHDHLRLVAASVMILTFGDAASSIVGRRFGENPNPLNRRKLIEGTAAGVFCAFIGAWFFVNWVAAFIGAVAAMIIETMDFRYRIYTVDDNLIMPLIAAVAMYPLL